MSKNLGTFQQHGVVGTRQPYLADTGKAAEVNVRRKSFILILVTFFLVPIGAWSSPNTNAIPKPKLIVTLVIDQFRADYLTRFESRFLPATQKGGKVGGFKYLMQNGAYFPFAQYDLLQSMTGPGHATVLTGAYPYQAGIPVNDWYDRDRSDRVYCTEDQSAPTVGASPSSPHVGTSPKNLIGTTVGDELKNAGFSSRVVSVAIKDRSAILMGGHRADLALWMDKDSFQWVSSQFYLPSKSLPDWVKKLNIDLEKRKGQALTWEPSMGSSGLSLEKSGVLKDDWNAGKIGEDFPHRAKAGSQGSLSLPLGLELTATAAEEAAKAFQLGRHSEPDLLAVSFSSHDYLGHAFGPNSREMEEMTLADDQVISGLLNFLNSEVPGGLKNVLLVLTADHGIPPNPDWLKENRINAGRIPEGDVSKQIEASLVEKYGKPDQGHKYVGYAESLNFYFDRKTLAEKKAPIAETETIAKTVLEHTPGIAHVFSSADYDSGLLPPGMHKRQIEHTFFKGRSGDVIAIPKPYFFITGDTVTHMTGYNYDRTVPIIFAGHGIRPGRYARSMEVIDIAPTLSFLSGVLPPSLSEGHVVQEVVTP